MFTDIIGQDKAIRVIERQLVSERIPHAYLFIGREGTGRKKAALEIAKVLNCQNPQKLEGSINACDECVSCKKIKKRVHPDIHIIDFYWQAALFDEDVEKQAELKIDTIRDMQKQVSLKPAEGKWKIFIIEPAEKLSQESANCILKTLEEPTENSIIILLAASANVLPQTIVSRCQCIRFQYLSHQNINRIINGINGTLDTGINDKIFRLAAGSVSEAIKIKESEEDVSLVLDLWEQLKSGKMKSIDLLDISNAISKDRNGVEEFMRRMLLLVSFDLEENPKLQNLAELILRCKQAIRYNVNLNLLTDIMLLRMKEILIMWRNNAHTS